MAEHDQAVADGADLKDQPSLIQLLVGRSHETYAKRREHITANADANFKKLWDVRRATKALANKTPKTRFGTKKMKFSPNVGDTSPGTGTS
jgi:hypothetical protein